MSRALVVDDNAVNVQVASAMLHQLGWESDSAEDGIEAVRRAMEFSYDLILMDAMMPRMDGWHAAAAIRGNEARLGRRRVPILGLSALSGGEDRQRGLAAGMDGWLTKPLTPADLRHALGLSQAVATLAGDEHRSETPLLDHGLADQLRALPGDVAAQSWREFAGRAGAEVAAIDEALRQRDTDAAARLVHRLRGMAGTLGLSRLCEALLPCERALRAGDASLWAPLPGLVERSRLAALAAADVRR